MKLAREPEFFLRAFFRWLIFFVYPSEGTNEGRLVASDYWGDEVSSYYIKMTGIPSATYNMKGVNWPERFPMCYVYSLCVLVCCVENFGNGTRPCFLVSSCAYYTLRRQSLYGAMYHCEYKGDSMSTSPLAVHMGAFA